MVIGNPPYVQLQAMKEISLILKEMNYETFESTGDLYCLFYEKGNDILKQKGVLGFITSNKWMLSKYGKPLRKYFNTKTSPYLFVDLGAGIFESAIVDSNIICFRKEKRKEDAFIALNLRDEKKFLDFSLYETTKTVKINPKTDEIWKLESEMEKSISRKIISRGISLKDWKININRGVLTGFNDAFIIDEDKKKELINIDKNSEKIIYPLLRGKDIERFNPNFSHYYLIGTFPSQNLRIDDFPAIKKHLETFGKRLEQSGENGCRKKTNNKWFETQDAISYLDEFFKENIIWKRIGSILRFSYGQNFVGLDSTCVMTGEYIKYLLCIFNSKMGSYLLKDSPKTGTGDLLISVQAFDDLFIPKPPSENYLIDNADLMLTLNKELQMVLDKFQRTLQREFSLETLSKKLQNWFELSFADFIKELSKQKVNLSLSQKAEWEDYFLAEQQTAVSVKSQIDQTDKEIDQMVYNLYGLTEEEIEIVEKS